MLNREDRLVILAANAPPIDPSFEQHRWSEEKIVPAPELGPGFIKRATITHRETELEHLIRWRMHYATKMLDKIERESK